MNLIDWFRNIYIYLFFWSILLLYSFNSVNPVLLNVNFNLDLMIRDFKI